MAQVYAAMLQAPYLKPASALRQAQIAMLRSRTWSHPYYWAAFVAEGEWR
jgi:CHAT domain-containing protein